MIPVLDHGYLKLIDTWGSDERIIEAARMSTNKGFKGWPEDEKLLRYLWTHKHMTPFEMAGMTIEVQAPIFVFREWHRHRTQSYNEMSGRYIELPDLVYNPSPERFAAGRQSTSNKQGSDDSVPFTEQEVNLFRYIVQYESQHSRKAYEELLERGVSRELARLVLPVNQYSRMRASANLRNWLGFLKLRMHSDAQWEIRQYANVVASVLTESFPRTMALFQEEL